MTGKGSDVQNSELVTFEYSSHKTTPILNSALLSLSLWIIFHASAPAQNVITMRGSGRVVEPTTISDEQLAVVLDSWADYTIQPHPQDAELVAETQRIVARLDSHIAEFLSGQPYAAFQNTLGISGYETYFSHPADLFHALAIAHPRLRPQTAADVRRYLMEQLTTAPPYAVDGYDRGHGRRRESYDVPADLQIRGTARASHTFGVYALWEYVSFVLQPPNAENDSSVSDVIQQHWPAINQRVAELLNREYSFDIRKHDYRKDEAENLSGDLAGLIGYFRLADIIGDADAKRRAQTRVKQLLQLRINLDRVNPRIYEATDSTTKHLHIGKLARYTTLIPEVGRALAAPTDGCASSHLQAFRESRPSWYLAFGERLIGGENYTNPPHLSRALFSGMALVENCAALEIVPMIDVPWCQGDCYFIEKSVIALWVCAGRPWHGNN